MQLRGRNSEPRTGRNWLSFVREELLSAAFTVTQQSHCIPGRFQGDEGSKTECGAHAWHCTSPGTPAHAASPHN